MISALQTIQSLRRRSPPPPTNDTKNHTTMRITMGVMCITILFVAATFGVAIVAAFWAKVFGVPNTPPTQSFSSGAELLLTSSQEFMRSSSSEFSTSKMQ